MLPATLTDMLFLFYCWKPTTREGETPFQGHTAIKQGTETLGSGKEEGGMSTSPVRGFLCQELVFLLPERGLALSGLPGAGQ